MRALLLLAVTKPRRLLALVVSALGAALYVWFAAVRAVPGVKARKAAFRASRARRREASRKVHDHEAMTPGRRPY